MTIDARDWGVQEPLPIPDREWRDGGMWYKIINGVVYGNYFLHRSRDEYEQWMLDITDNMTDDSKYALYANAIENGGYLGYEIEMEYAIDLRTGNVLYEVAK